MANEIFVNLLKQAAKTDCDRIAFARSLNSFVFRDLRMVERAVLADEIHDLRVMFIDSINLVAARARYKPYVGDPYTKNCVHGKMFFKCNNCGDQYCADAGLKFVENQPRGK